MIVQVAVAVIYCLFSSGIVFGYAALKPVLIREGVYGEYCSSRGSVHREKTCYEQEIRYYGCSQSIETVADRMHLLGSISCSLPQRWPSTFALSL